MSVDQNKGKREKRRRKIEERGIEGQDRVEDVDGCVKRKEKKGMKKKGGGRVIEKQMQ